MKVLVIGGGGREHALAWKLAQSPKVQAVYVAPGNGGTALDPRLENVPITDLRQLRDWALKQKIALTVVGPEAPLAAGVVDDFRAHGLRVFGPTQAAAQLESSKAFSKAFMRRLISAPSPILLEHLRSASLSAWEACAGRVSTRRYQAMDL